jgi:tetratricopeptide (TPR) repeat protein
MKSELLLAAFTPSIMSHEVLESIFVRREALATRLLENLRTSATTRSKRHALLVGPRGIGKTHLVSLLYHRVKDDTTLNKGLCIAWLREETWEITSFLDLLESILRALAAEYADEKLSAALAELQTLPAETAETRAECLLLDFLGDRILLLILENLDDLFAALEEFGQRQLRAFLQNHTNTVLLATTPSLFYGVSDHDAPFFNFFNVTHLDDLSLDDAVRLLEKIADLREDSDLAAFLRTDTARNRLEAVQHLAGGHPRIWIFFAGIVTEEALDELVPIFLRMLDDLTPYYQSRMKELPPQQRKIVTVLCTRRSAIPVKEIADACRLSHQATAAQLHRLQEKAFVRSEAIGRESWYELNEPLMRLVFEIKESRGQPIRLIVDFLRRWYSRSERRAKYATTPIEAPMTRQYIEAALDLKGVLNWEPYAPQVLLQFLTYSQLESTRGFQKELDTVEEVIDRAGAASVADQWAYHSLCLCGLKRYEEALMSCNIAITLDPNSVEAHLWHANILHDCERYEEALAGFDRAIKLEPKSAVIYNNRGATLQALKFYDLALASYDQALELDPANASVYINRGNTLQSLHRYEEALASYERSLEIDPVNAAAYYNYGLVLLDTNRYEEALVSYNKAVEIDPADFQSYIGRGNALSHLRRYEEALASYDRAIGIDSTDTIVHNNRGAVLQDLKRYGEALASVDRAIELKPSEATAYNIRGNILCYLKRYEEAVASYGRAVEINPTDVQSYIGRGNAFFHLNRYEDALASYDMAIELQAGHTNTYYNRGLALHELKRYEEALASFDRAIELGDENARYARNRTASQLRHAEFLANLQQAFPMIPMVEKERPSYARMFFVLILRRNEAQSEWPACVADLVVRYANLNALRWLGQELTDSLPALFEQGITNDIAAAWNAAWQEAGRDHTDLVIPLRLLDAAVQWHRKPDRRILLRLPVEERRVLEKILPR